MSENDNYPQHDKYQCTHCNGTGTIIVFDKLPLENATLDSRDLKGTCRVCKGFGYTFVPNENACYHEYLAKEHLEENAKMLLQVHDELVFDIPISEKEIFEKLVRETMENVMMNYQ